MYSFSSLSLPGLITSKYAVQKFLTILVVLTEKSQSSSHSLLFVFICQNSGNPPGTHFSVAQITTNNFIKNCSWNFRKEQTQSIYNEQSTLLSFFPNPWFEFASHNWRSAWALLIMNIRLPAIKHDAPFFNWSFIRHMTINLGYLSVNFNRADFFTFKNHITLWTSHLARLLI